MNLLFDSAKLPRTMKRSEWKAIDSWRRSMVKTLSRDLARQVENVLIYGTNHPEWAAEARERIINPPILIGPHQRL